MASDWTPTEVIVKADLGLTEREAAHLLTLFELAGYAIVADPDGLVGDGPATLALSHYASNGDPVCRVARLDSGASGG